MPKPLVIAYHLVWTAYGWWLPNDPRGSMSKWIADEDIETLGDAHYGRKQHQPPRQTVKRFYEQAAETLQHPLLKFSPNEFAIVADGLARCVAERKYTCYAAAVMPDGSLLIPEKHPPNSELAIMIERLVPPLLAGLISVGILSAIISFDSQFFALGAMCTVPAHSLLAPALA